MRCIQVTGLLYGTINWTFTDKQMDMSKQEKKFLNANKNHSRENMSWNFADKEIEMLKLKKECLNANKDDWKE